MGKAQYAVAQTTTVSGHADGAAFTNWYEYAGAPVRIVIKSDPNLCGGMASISFDERTISGRIVNTADVIRTKATQEKKAGTYVANVVDENDQITDFPIGTYTYAFEPDMDVSIDGALAVPSVISRLQDSTYNGANGSVQMFMASKALTNPTPDNPLYVPHIISNMNISLDFTKAPEYLESDSRTRVNMEGEDGNLSNTIYKYVLATAPQANNLRYYFSSSEVALCATDAVNNWILATSTGYTKYLESVHNVLDAITGGYIVMVGDQVVLLVADLKGAKMR